MQLVGGVFLSPPTIIWHVSRMMQEELFFCELDDEALVPETISSSGLLPQHKIRGNLPFSTLLYFMSHAQ